MQFKTYLDEIEATIREHDGANEFTLTHKDGSYNTTYDGEWICMRGKRGARVLRGATPAQSVIQWLDGPKMDHTSKCIVVESATKDTALQIMATLRRGY